MLVNTVLGICYLLHTPLLQIKAPQTAIISWSKPEFIILLIKGHASYRILVVVIEESVLVLHEVSVEDLAVSASRVTLLEGGVGLNGPDGVGVEEA